MGESASIWIPPSWRSQQSAQRTLAGEGSAKLQRDVRNVNWLKCASMRPARLATRSRLDLSRAAARKWASHEGTRPWRCSSSANACWTASSG
jgi:hypothetical protein